MKRVKFLAAFGVILFFIYLAVPDSGFPDPPRNSLQSDEPGDTETPLRRAYFTNLARSEIIEHYKSEFSYLPYLRLNYPPEDSSTVIRDQTRSTYLEELLHPFRESVFINGFEPRDASEAIFIKGQDFEQKITVRYIPSSSFVRIFVVGSGLILTYAVIREYWDEVKFLGNKVRRYNSVKQ